MLTTAAATTSGVPIQIQEVEKVYLTKDGPVHALAGVSLDIAPGEFISIVGPSGCGKSTLMMLVAGLVPVTSGQIRIANQPVTRPQTELGIVFQDAVLLDWRTVLDNVLLQQEIRRLPRAPLEQRARELLAMVGLAGFEQKHPYELSGGMRQRTAICRALVHDPPLLLMDEPFGALDALTREQIAHDLQRLWLQTGKTVLFITHSIVESVLLSDRVVVMTPRPGRIEEVLTIDLPRPRRLDETERSDFTRYTTHIRRIFRAQGVLSE
ncbi:MAG: ABC transporter ATP-binding protein [Chloroflexi bacterium]|jgi:NitT/TauT family transport system ATP-binding protein|nr:ABC transporter ATP-binding protein [Chloroflexota bacterium]GIW09501.1 MAG: ABC transporter ATP-binding protein [Dehalococcoidia bacterium]